MPSQFGTSWNGKPELHKIVDSTTGRTHYFFDQAPQMRTFEGTNQPFNEQGLPLGENETPTYTDGFYYASPDIGQVRQEWARQFPGVEFPDASSATPGQGINAQGNGTPGTFSSQEMTERGNGGHGSWWDQQGTEIMGDALFAGLGYTSGGLGTALAAPFMDNSAESQRNMRAGTLGGLAASIFGAPSTSGGNVGDTSNANYGDSTLSGSSGNSSLVGNAGGNTDNYFGDYLTDPETGDVTLNQDYRNGTDLGNYDPSDYRLDNPDQFPSDTPPDIMDSIKNLPSAAKTLLGRLLTGGGGAGGKSTLGQSILGQVGSDPLSAAFSATPFLLALHEANKQGGDINDTIGRMRSLEDSVSGNSSPYMNALLNPYDQQTGTGRASLLQDQGLRGIRGSSFGDQSLNSYDYTRDLGRGDIASKALLGSAGLQGNLMNSQLGAINARNTNRNLLLGAGLSASGRLFQPEKDPFNLNTLLGLA